jgi:predicted PolB exonuclease-like 3'-5' exonuclease
MEVARIRAATDLETLGREARIRAEFKKPETIEAKLAELRAGAAQRFDEAIRATALDGSLGEIIAIGFALDDVPAEALIRSLEGSERELIADFFGRLPAPAQASPVIVGHNIEFDVRFLWQRCVVLGLCPSLALTAEDRARTSCTMQTWAGRWNRDRWPSLHQLCLALGVPSPKADGVDGSQVFDLVRSGAMDRVRDYCRADVEAVRAVHRRLTFAAICS